jgi:hypothetical protein
VLAARVLVLWVALLVLALVVDLPFLVNRYFPRHRSLKVTAAHGSAGIGRIIKTYS